MGRARIPIPEAKITAFCHRNQVKSLELFGSVLRADFRPDSDVDVLVEFEPGARIGFLALGRMQRELAALLERPVDLVPKDGLKPVIRQDVLASTEVIYAG
jgi:predicted nucleotidyltransferase